MFELLNMALNRPAQNIFKECVFLSQYLVRFQHLIYNAFDVIRIVD